MKRGFLGRVGSNSHRVALTIGPQDELVSLSSFGLGQALAKDEIDQAVLPVENSTDGDVSWALRILKMLKKDYSIVGEAVLKIDWKLAGFGLLNQVKKVASHPQGLAQCGIRIGEMGLETQEADSTTVAVELVVQCKDPALAAICTERAALENGVPLIAGNISDDAENVTRFVVVGRDKVSPTGCDRTSILFGTQNKHGALRRVLDILDVMGINMTMIISKPAGGKLGAYVFFVDVEGNVADEKLGWALRLLQDEDPRNGGSVVESLRILGSYPRAQEVINA